MTLDQFITLDAIVTFGSFRAAAEKLNKVQSAISYTVRTMEEELGFALFSRETYRPSLTKEGHAIYQKVQLILADMAEINQFAQHLTMGEEPIVAIDIAGTCPIEKVIPILQEISQKFPATQIKISSEVLGSESLVLKDEVDVAITHVLQTDNQLEIIPWKHFMLAPVSATDHPLARENATVHNSEVLKHFQVVVSSASSRTTSESHGVFQGCSTWVVGTFEAKRDLILANMGWGNMPLHLVQPYIDSGQMKFLNIPGLEPIKVALQLVRKRRQTHGPVVKKLWELLVASNDNTSTTISRAGIDS